MRAFRIGIAALALTVLANPAWADVAGRYETTDKKSLLRIEMTIETDDAGDVRLQSAGQPSYLLLKAGVLYSVTRGATGPVVTRVADVLTIQAESMRRMGMSDSLASATDKMPRMKFAAIGPEKVGVWQGTAYGVKSDSGKPGPYAEFVLSDDPRIAPLGKAIVAMQGGMPGRMNNLMPGMGRLGQDLIQLLSKGTPVRMISVALTDVSYDRIDPDRFALPAPPETIGLLRAQAEPFPAPPTLPPRKKEP